MRIETYFQRLCETIEASAIVQSFNMTYDKRGPHEGFIRGELYLVDGSILHVREFVDVEVEVERLVYVYQYMDSARMLVFRYDNTGHHKRLSLPTYPHHKHQGSEDNVVASEAPDLSSVLAEIETVILLPWSAFRYTRNSD